MTPAVATLPRDIAWDDFPRRWARLTPPLRPDADVCAEMRRLIAGYEGESLLLGVTPELADLSERTLAVDCSARMLRLVWPGNTASRRAVRGHWLRLPAADRTFATAIGDGSLSCLKYPLEYELVFAELARTVRPGGRVAIRTFLRPEPGDTLEAVRRRTLAGQVRSVHALKWLLAHAECGERGEDHIQANSIHRTFCRLFPCRADLAGASGWSPEAIAVIDLFEGCVDTFSFPSAAQVLGLARRVFADARLVAAGSYEIAERCPLLVGELP